MIVLHVPQDVPFIDQSAVGSQLLRTEGCLDGRLSFRTLRGASYGVGVRRDDFPSYVEDDFVQRSG